MFLQNFVPIGETVAELLQIKYFQYGGSVFVSSPCKHLADKISTTRTMLTLRSTVKPQQKTKPSELY